MRKFKERIFFGTENCLEKCYILHKRLEQAFTILSGLQQPDHSDTEEIAKQAEEYRFESEKNLLDIGLDIITALNISDEILKDLGRKKLKDMKYRNSIADQLKNIIYG